MKIIGAEQSIGVLLLPLAQLLLSVALTIVIHSGIGELEGATDRSTEAIDRNAEAVANMFEIPSCMLEGKL